MLVRLVLLPCLAVMLLVPSAALAAAERTIGTGPGQSRADADRPTVERGLLYASPDGEPLRMDLWRPTRESPGGAPAMLWVHGGGFHSGDRTRMAAYARRSAEAGMVAATIDYRLLPHEKVRRLGLEAASTRPPRRTPRPRSATCGQRAAARHRSAAHRHRGRLRPARSPR